MRASDLDYDLPEALVAQHPPTERDAGRLLVLDGDTGAITHRRVLDLPQLLRPALFVVNDTRVIPARVFATKPTGGKVELLLVERLGDEGTVERWTALARGQKSLRPGMILTLAEGRVTGTVRALREGGEVELELESARGTVMDVVREVGRVPLPPYVRREDDASDRARYQTIFAARDGSVAAPTASLHFSHELLAALGRAGHQVARVTLHVGLGTFAPLRTDDLDAHRMHEERYEVPAETAVAVAAARAEGRPVVAVGTTACRALESAIDEHGVVRARAGRTSLFIRPPYAFRAIDALVTNFHLPRSTLLALVMAFGGEEYVRAAYAAAVRAEYRFFSYGDAMLVRQRSEVPRSVAQAPRAGRASPS